MKRILLALIIVSAASQLKAQQLFTKPADSVSLFKSPKSLPNFQLADSSLFKKFEPLAKSNQLATIPSIDGTSEIFYSRMPVARIGGNMDNMSIIKPAEPNMHYPLLIKKMKVADPLSTVKPVNP
jgi:hypothetical protein